MIMSVNSNCNLATPCGLYCGECLFYEKPCKGCVPSGGKPSWGKCKTYACATEKKVEHCGECGEFPCSLFLNQYSRELGPWRVFYKAGQLLYRKKIGKREYLNDLDSRKLMRRLNRLFESEVEIPRIRHGKKQTLDTLITEEATLLAQYLRNEKKAWIPRITIPN